VIPLRFSHPVDPQSKREAVTKLVPSGRFFLKKTVEGSLHRTGIAAKSQRDNLQRWIFNGTLAGMNGGRETRSVGCFFGFAQLEIALAGVGGLGGIHAGAETGFFQEVAPAFVGVRRTLAILVFAHGGFGVLASLDDFDHTSRDIGTHVVAN